MNILIVSTGILPQPAVKGGAVETLVDTLIKYNEKTMEHNIKIYTVYDEKAVSYYDKYKKCKFISVKINKMIRYLFNKGIIPTRVILNIFTNKVAKDIKNINDFDVVLLQNEFRYAKKIKKQIGSKPFILHLHNDYVNKEVKGIEKKIKIFNSVITVSNFLKQRIEEVDNSIEIKTIHNGIDLKKFKKIDGYQRKKIREKYGIKDDEIIIVFAGRLIKEKGIKELLLAFNQIPREFKIKLLVVGNSFFNENKENKFVKELKNIAKDNKNNIIFTGFIPYEKMNEIYSIADIGCVPSIWAEPFGLTVVEQMAMQLPMIVSNVGAIPEIVDKECALIVNNNDEYILNLKNTIIELYYNETLRKKMGEISIKLSENFSDIKFSDNIFKYLEEEYERNTQTKN
ncbi:glycosyltransferase family 4 protein [Clostridium saudiense]|uniref:glycosyltransferase family 4 protein n=1 Tax=Clostridium saudiense TaxID=1414720 RepID=UPI00319E2413